MQTASKPVGSAGRQTRPRWRTDNAGNKQLRSWLLQLGLHEAGLDSAGSGLRCKCHKQCQWYYRGHHRHQRRSPQQWCLRCRKRGAEVDARHAGLAAPPMMLPSACDDEALLRCCPLVLYHISWAAGAAGVEKALQVAAGRNAPQWRLHWHLSGAWGQQLVWSPVASSRAYAGSEADGAAEPAGPAPAQGMRACAVIRYEGMGCSYDLAAETSYLHTHALTEV